MQIDLQTLSEEENEAILANSMMASWKGFNFESCMESIGRYSTAKEI